MLSRSPSPFFSSPLATLLSVALFTAALPAPSAWAAGTEVMVRGQVVDEGGEPIRGARITLTRVDDPEWREELKSKRSGRFKIFLRDGAKKFDVRVEKDGYQTTESRIEPLVFASDEERRMGLGGTRAPSFEIDFTLRSLVAEMQAASAQSIYNEGVAAARKRQFDDAVERFRRVLEMEPEHDAARLALVKVYHDMRRPVEAAELLAEILEEEEVKVPTLELSYHVMRDAGRLDEAAAALDRLWEKAPQAAADELFELATIRRSQGDKDGARSAVERVLEVRPTQADAHYFYARLLHAMQEPEAAIRHFRRFLELDPDSPLAEGVESKIRQIEAEGGDS